MFILVRTPSGQPIGYPMTGLFRSGALEITTYRKAAKARALLADPRVCCIVPDDERTGHGVRLFGRAVPADDVSGFANSTRGSSAAIDVPDDIRETVRARLDSDKRMVFRIAVERWDEIGTGA